MQGSQKMSNLRVALGFPFVKAMKIGHIALAVAKAFLYPAGLISLVSTVVESVN